MRATLRGTETVLLVDDDASARNLVRLVLQKNGYTVLEAGNGQEALRVQERHQGTIHLLVTDVLMPHLDGPALAKRRRDMRPTLKVLYISGQPKDTSLAETVGGAGAGFLLKPFTLDALAGKVRGLLDG